MSSAEAELAYYEYENHKLQKTLCTIEPIPCPERYVVMLNKADRMTSKIYEIFYGVLDTLRVGFVPPKIIIHITVGDRLDVTLQEYKARSYISVWENDDYILRLKCDAARWRFAIQKVHDGGYSFRDDLTHTAYYYQAPSLNLEQMNEKAITYCGKRQKRMFKETIDSYHWEYEALGEKIDIRSLLL